MSPANGVDASSLNCQVLYCPFDEGVQTTGTRASGTYDLIRIDCGGDSAGGQISESDFKISVTNNPDYDSSLKKRHAPEVEREHPRQLLSKRDVPASVSDLQPLLKQRLCG